MTKIERHILPGRRHVETRKVYAPNAQVLHLSVGYDPREPARPLEVFYSAGLKSGSDLEYHMQDMCVLISLLLQRGMEPCEISRSLSRQERPDGDITFATLTGFVLQEIAKPPMWDDGEVDDEGPSAGPSPGSNDDAPEPPHSGGAAS